MKRLVTLAAAFAGGVALVSGVLALAQDKGKVQSKPQEYEKKVKEADVPKAALESLKKLAGGEAITEFAEEFEHGHKYYEGSWKGPHGNVDGLVSEDGAVVELEESLPMDQIPLGVQEQLKKAAGNDATIKVERKTLYVFEGHFKKDGKKVEAQFTAEGRPYQEEDGDGGEEADEKDDD